MHVVCPIFGNEDGNEKALIRACILNVLQQAEYLKVETISFPPLSVGIFGFPTPLVANEFFGMLNVHLNKNLRHLKEVRVITFVT
jgi:O-acetyl-ADP-ribose deacetylase (regulator of RNase III)